MSLRPRFLLSAAVLALVIPLAAHASTITSRFSFSVSDLTGSGATHANPFHGDFTITYDPSLNYSNSTSIAVNSLNITLGSTMSFTYDAAGDVLNIGGLQTNDGSGTQLLAYNSNDFQMQINNFWAGPGFWTLGYNTVAYTQTDGSYYYYDSSKSSYTLTSLPVSAVPISTTLPLLASGLAALGFLGWQERRKPQSSRA